MTKITVEDWKNIKGFKGLFEEEAKLRRPRRHIEDDLQMTCVRWFSLQFPTYAQLLHHSPNGGFRNTKEAARFKAMGTRAGFPDLILLLPRGKYHALCIEMKTEEKTSKQTSYQKQYQKLLEEQGYKYVICRSLDDFIRIIYEYLKETAN